MLTMLAEQLHCSEIRSENIERYLYKLYIHTYSIVEDVIKYTGVVTCVSGCFGHVFSCQSLLLSTTILNDNVLFELLHEDHQSINMVLPLLIYGSTKMCQHNKVIH